MNKTPYELFAVWIHSGVATTGHYWAYLRDFKANKWRKFNDVFVSDVDEKTVFEDAIGGSNSGVSAYFLVSAMKDTLHVDSALTRTRFMWAKSSPRRLLRALITRPWCLIIWR